MPPAAMSVGLVGLARSARVCVPQAGSVQCKRNLDRRRAQRSVADLVQLANHQAAGVADTPSLQDNPAFLADDERLEIVPLNPARHAAANAHEHSVLEYSSDRGGLPVYKRAHYFTAFLAEGQTPQFGARYWRTKEPRCVTPEEREMPPLMYEDLRPIMARAMGVAELGGDNSV